MRIYRNINEIKHINVFLKIIETQNVCLLDKDYEEGNKYTDEQINEFNGIWVDIYDEFFRLKDDPNSRKSLRDSQDLIVLLHKINIIVRQRDWLVYLQDIQQTISDESFLEYEQAIYHQLKDIHPNIKPLYFEGISANISNLDRVLKAMTNTYNLKKKESDRVVKKEKENVYVTMARMEKSYGQSIPNVEEITTGRYLGIEKVVKELEAAKKQENGRKHS